MEVPITPYRGRNAARAAVEVVGNRVDRRCKGRADRCRRLVICVCLFSDVKRRAIGRQLSVDGKAGRACGDIAPRGVRKIAAALDHDIFQRLARSAAAQRHLKRSCVNIAASECERLRVYRPRCFLDLQRGLPGDKGGVACARHHGADIIGSDVCGRVRCCPLRSCRRAVAALKGCLAPIILHRRAGTRLHVQRGRGGGRAIEIVRNHNSGSLRTLVERQRIGIRCDGNGS